MNLSMFWMLMAAVIISPHLSENGAWGAGSFWIAASLYYFWKGE